MATDDLGIDDGWWSAEGSWCAADPDTLALLRERFEASSSAPADPVWFVREATAPPLHSIADLRLKDASTLADVIELPADLPLGVHELFPHDAGPRTVVIVVPDGGHAWPVQRRWGVTAQAFGARTRGSLTGDLDGIASIARWLTAKGGTVLGVSPLGDPIPTAPRQPSPYSPSSRRHIDPLLLPLTDEERPRDPVRDRGELLDRDRAWAVTRSALRDRWRSLPDDERARRIGATELDLVAPHRDRDLLHAVFGALAELHDGGWTSWPVELRDASSTEVIAAATSMLEPVAWWRWVDEECERAFAELTAELRRWDVALMGDLPVGVALDGADAWIDRDVMCEGWHIGAPPDPFGPTGQDWALPPFDPHLLRASGYEPLLSTFRSNLSRYDGLRVDHVMGLSRLFVIPPGGDPRHGTYIRSRPDELWDLLAMEAARHGSFLVGEDLGTVEDGVRGAMESRGMGGTRVGWFEKELPPQWPEQSLGTLTTHDLPTVLGVLSGTDPAADPSMDDRIRGMVGRGPDEDPTDVLVAAHEHLSAAGSAIVLAALDDVVGSHLRVNLPGTIDEYPNWRMPLPVAVDELDGHPTAERVVEALRSSRP